VTAQSPPEALRLAALLASQATAGIVLLHVIEVPYTLPLDVSEPGGDQRGSYLREFRRLLEAEGLVVEVKVARSRRAGKVIADMARALRPRAVVLSAQPRRGGLSATAAYVLENTPSSRVIIYKASSEAAAATPLPVEQAGRRPAS
jgi:nucleotide-binding universal stress UspA family protein